MDLDSKRWNSKLDSIKEKYHKQKLISYNDYLYIQNRISELDHKLKTLSQEKIKNFHYDTKFDVFNTFLQKIIRHHNIPIKSRNTLSMYGKKTRSNSPTNNHTRKHENSSPKKSGILTPPSLQQNSPYLSESDSPYEPSKSPKVISHKYTRKNKDYYQECDRIHEKKHYVQAQCERDLKQLNRISERCLFENFKKEYHSKFNIPSFKTLHPSLFDMKEDIQESIHSLTSKLDKVYPYNNSIRVGNILFYNLLYKYRSKCFVTPLKDTTLSPPTIPGLNTKELLGLFIDPSKAFDKVFPFDYIEYLGLKLKKCIKKSKDLILLPLLIFAQTASIGHANMIIYKPEENKVYRFEPEGSRFSKVRFDETINNHLKTLFEVKLTPYIGNVSYIEPIGICPNLHGLQHFEESIDKESDIEGNGYCMMWSLLFAEMVLLNPTKPLMSILNELLTITNRDPEQLRKLIRGYTKLSTDILKELSAIFLKKKIHSYNDFSDYLANAKDSKYSVILKLLVKFTTTPRVNSPHS